MATDHVAAVRRFNRFYTRIIGALDEGHLESRFALTEVRLLFEITHRENATATDLVRDLGLDAGYVSRLLRGLARRRLVRSTRSAADGRERHLALTPMGRTTVTDLEARASADVARLLVPLTAGARTELVGAMARVEALFARQAAPPMQPSITVRSHQPGDMGWVVQRHGELYFREYGWDERFEALVAGIVARFIEHLDPARERCWIAERDGERVGCIFLAQQTESKGVAQLRLFLVEPGARGHGIGRRLVADCIAFARAAGYHTLMLWTNDVLVSARRIYVAEGFQLRSEEKHDSYGHALTAQTWELAL